jgi:benzil reductase ((S)-benzoin forming)
MKTKHAYITGTSRGLGKALAEVLLEEGWSVTGVSRTNAIEHPAYRHVEADLGASWQEWLPDIFQEHSAAGKLVLINNAGMLGDVGYMGTLSSEALAQAFAVNITAPALLQNEFIRHYPQHQKLVLNISSGAAQYPVDGWSAYCSSKAALDMLSEVAAHEAGLANRQDLKVFSIAPGVVDTPMQEQIRGVEQSNFSRVGYFRELKKDKQLADPREVAQKLLLFMNKADRFKEVKQDVRKL